MNKFYNYKKGYTLVETLIYFTVFVFISLVVVSMILSVLKTSRQVEPVNSLSRGAVSILEIITREIRSAKGINMANSIFSTSDGRLELHTLDEDDNPRVVRFYLASSTVNIDENGIYLGPLSSNNVQVESLKFGLASSSSKKLIHIELELSAGTGTYFKSEKFYSSVMIRTSN